MKTVYVQTLSETFSVSFEDEHSPTFWDEMDENDEIVTIHGFDKRDLRLRQAIETYNREYYYDLQHLVRLSNGETIDEYTILEEGETIGLMMKSIDSTFESDDLEETVQITFGGLQRFQIMFEKEERYSLKKIKKMLRRETFHYYPEPLFDQIAESIHQKFIL
jgi:hypothetical protein